jgi:hypothetical protein
MFSCVQYLLDCPEDWKVSKIYKTSGTSQFGIPKPTPEGGLVAHFSYPIEVQMQTSAQCKS